MIAVICNRHEMVKFLVSLGANMEIPSKSEETALVFAVHEQNAAIVETLVHAGANVNHLDSTQENLLLRAVRMHRADVLRALLSHETNDGVSTAFIDSAFKEAVMQPVLTILDFPCTQEGFEQLGVEELKQVSRIDMIRRLIPMVSDCGLVSDHEVFGSCARLHCTVAALNSDYHVCELLLRYGFAWSGGQPNIRQSLVQLLLPLLNNESDWSFARLLIQTSDDRNLLKYVMLVVMWTIRTAWHVCPELRLLYEKLKFATDCLSKPLSLQDLCVIAARTRLRGRMWSKIDALPLPSLLKGKLKLV